MGIAEVHSRPCIGFSKYLIVSSTILTLFSRELVNRYKNFLLQLSELELNKFPE